MPYGLRWRGDGHVVEPWTHAYRMVLLVAEFTGGRFGKGLRGKCLYSHGRGGLARDELGERSALSRLMVIGGLEHTITISEEIIQLFP